MSQALLLPWTGGPGSLALSSKMQPLAEYYQDRISLTKQLFFARHSAPVLLHRRKAESEAGSFQTRFTGQPTLVNNVRLSEALPQLGLKAGPGDGGSLIVYALRKRPGSPFVERITVGRTRNQDLCLPTGQVSKLHAYFTMLEGGESYSLTDNGSTNGTFVSGKRLVPEQPVELRSGALVQFGDFQALFFTPAALYALLKPDTGAG